LSFNYKKEAERIVKLGFLFKLSLKPYFRYHKSISQILRTVYIITNVIIQLVTMLDNTIVYIIIKNQYELNLRTLFPNFRVLI